MDFIRLFLYDTEIDYVTFYGINWYENEYINSLIESKLALWAPEGNMGRLNF